MTLRPLPDRSDVPGIIRLRRALKVLLRSFGLRCTQIAPAAESSLGNTPGQQKEQHANGKTPENAGKRAEST